MDELIKKVDELSAVVNIVKSKHDAQGFIMDSMTQAIKENAKAITSLTIITGDTNKRTERIEAKLDNGITGKLNKLEQWVDNHGKTQSKGMLKKIDPLFNFIEKHYKVIIVFLALIGLGTGIISVAEIKEIWP